MAAGTAIAGAAGTRPDPASKLLWATIDVCDSPAHPDTVGIRGSMPGNGDPHAVLYMSFRLEYRTTAGSWKAIGAPGLLPFVRVGSGAATARQAGEDATIAPSATATVLRAVVVFQWRRHGVILATYARSTTAGHTAAAGADPPGYSAATCRISRTGAGRS